ncbi:MAG TPA: SDR family NAD(P)-dependent oxidoreductase [Casimicrobiaceae bacterium]
MLPSDDRVVMVSGANRGIGLAVARCLRDKGYRLSLGSRDAAKLDAALGGLDESRVIACAFDARDRTSCEAWVERTASHFGRIDGLVNNAGISRNVGIEDDDESAYDEMWDVNVKGPLRLIRLALPYLKRSGSGRIVNVASLSGKRVKNLHAGYAMSKFALVALTHAVRRAGWEDGVRATAVCPSFVATDMTAQVTAVPRTEMVQPADLAELVALALALPNNAVVAELLVNCRLEDMF